MTGEVVSLLDRPVYLFGEVDRLLGLDAGTARRWINGYSRSGRKYPPIVRTERSEQHWATWGEFVETRLLAEFRQQKISIRQMRIVVERLREEFGQRYPLAHARPFLRQEGRDIVMRAQQDAKLGDDLFVVVRNGQVVLSPRTERFHDAATYTDAPDDSFVSRIEADPRYPAIAIDPEHKSGRPTVVGRAILVTTLADMVLAGDRVADVAEWYELQPDQVQQAVDFTVTHNLAA